MILIAFLAVVSSQVLITSPEPRPASPWVQSTRATCGNANLTISGYGPAKPLTNGAQIGVNGRRVTGEGAPQLLADLSRRRAVYRLELLCDPRGQIILRINVGEKHINGAIEYRSGVATILGSTLKSYSGLMLSNSDTFWFR